MEMEREQKDVNVCQKPQTERHLGGSWWMFFSCQRFSRDYNNFLIFILLTFVRAQQ